MKIHCLIVFSIGILLAVSPVGSEPTSTISAAVDHQGPIVPRLEPHGEQICASGCALSRHPTPELKADKFSELMAAYATEPMSEESPALEELLFYGIQTKGFLLDSDHPKIDQQRLTFLKRELERDQVIAEFRIIDESGKVRVGLPPTSVSLDRRYVFEPLNTQDFQPPEASGTIKRVGLNHLWQRI